MKRSELMDVLDEMGVNQDWSTGGFRTSVDYTYKDEIYPVTLEYQPNLHSDALILTIKSLPHTVNHTKNKISYNRAFKLKDVTSFDECLEYFISDVVESVINATSPETKVRADYANQDFWFPKLKKDYYKPEVARGFSGFGNRMFLTSISDRCIKDPDVMTLDKLWDENDHEEVFEKINEIYGPNGGYKKPKGNSIKKPKIKAKIVMAPRK